MWGKIGDFEKIYPHVQLTRLVSYQNIDADLIVRKVELCGYIDFSFAAIEIEIFRTLKMDTKPPAKVVSMALSKTAQIKQQKEPKDSGVYGMALK